MDHKTSTAPPRFADEVPSMPVAANTAALREDVAALRGDVAALREDVAALRAAECDFQETARRINETARQLNAVAATATIKLNNKQKMYVAGTALALVGVGVGGTLIVQKVASRRSAKSPMMPANK